MTPDEKQEIQDELGAIERCQHHCPRFDLHREQRAEYLRKLLTSEQPREDCSS